VAAAHSSCQAWFSLHSSNLLNPPWIKSAQESWRIRKTGSGTRQRGGEKLARKRQQQPASDWPLLLLLLVLPSLLSQDEDFLYLVMGGACQGENVVVGLAAPPLHLLTLV